MPMKSDNRESPRRRELCQFGLGLGALGGVVGGLLLWNGRSLGIPVLMTALFLAVAFCCEAPGIRLFYATWMKLAGFMARFITTLLLSLMYLLVLTPIALLGRSLGKRFVERGFREEKGSYWIPRVEAESKKNYEKQS